MVQMVLSKPVAAPQRVALRTQARSLAAPLVARISRQTRRARVVITAAADKASVRSTAYLTCSL